MVWFVVITLRVMIRIVWLVVSTLRVVIRTVQFQ